MIYLNCIGTLGLHLWLSSVNVYDDNYFIGFFIWHDVLFKTQCTFLRFLKIISIVCNFLQLLIFSIETNSYYDNAVIMKINKL